jgi:nickel transport protein
MMKFGLLAAILFVFPLAGVQNASAHRVNIFAYVDGAYVQVECSFNKSRKVRQGAVTVFDSVSGALLLSGATDDEGGFRFPLSEIANDAKMEHGLRIRINAGEGHENEWFLNADTLKSASRAEEASAGESVQAFSAFELERIINNALDVKLAPIKHMLAEQFNPSPRLGEIIGGIGWIFGLAGIAAYFKRRP